MTAIGGQREVGGALLGEGLEYATRVADVAVETEEIRALLQQGQVRWTCAYHSVAFSGC